MEYAERIYVAGAINADNVIDVLANIRRGIKYCAKLLKAWQIPFCPFIDYQFAFFEELTIEQYYRYSMAFLEVCQKVHVLPFSENSTGTRKEIERALELGIPVIYLTEDDLE